MDIIAITETSEDNEHSFITNVDIDGYALFSTPTLSTKGGTAIYVNNIYKPNLIERIDLNTQTEDFESIWVEIKNPSNKNIVCGCVYRHPRQNISEFLEYMDATLNKLTDENKEIYICGDFNIDLLKTESNKSSSDFFSLLNSNGFLPLILHPTRVVDRNVPSLIDNIFSNNVDHETISGNIYLKLSEHFPQFATINRGKIDIKKILMFGRDTSKFNEQNYRDDVSIQKWLHDTNDPNLLMSDFIWRLDGCTNRHAPVKKLNSSEIKTRLKPWITPDIRKLINLRDKLFARKKRQPENQTVRETYN